MPRCPDCTRDLPPFQTLCSECYEARYAEVSRPKSLLQSIRQFGTNPRRQQVIKDRINAQPWWVAWCLAVIGLAVDWRCAFEWFAGKSPFYSELVLGRALLIVLACAGIALLATRSIRERRFLVASVVFCVLSVELYRFLSSGWIAHRR
jgi:hypothetical protein